MQIFVVVLSQGRVLRSRMYPDLASFIFDESDLRSASTAASENLGTENAAIVASSTSVNLPHSSTITRFTTASGLVSRLVDAFPAFADRAVYHSTGM